MNPLRLLPLGLVLATSLSHAQPSLTEGLARCQRVDDATARLACYDALARAHAASPAATAPNAPSPASPSGPATAGATPTAVPSAATPAAKPQDADFGRTSANSNSLQSRILGSFEGWVPRQRFRLANGQLWEVTDGTSGYYRSMKDPEMKIVKGFLSGYYLEIEGVNQRIGVKRIE